MAPYATCAHPAGHEGVDVGPGREERQEGGDAPVDHRFVRHRVPGAVLLSRRMPEKFERVGVRVDQRIEVAEVSHERAERPVGGGEEGVERDVLHQHGAVVTRDAGEVEVVVREVDGEGEHAQSVVVGRAFAGRKLPGVVAE